MTGLQHFNKEQKGDLMECIMGYMQNHLATTLQTCSNLNLFYFALKISLQPRPKVRFPLQSFFISLIISIEVSDVEVMTAIVSRSFRMEV